jgi:eukaryotic-like serine/threonine-protein kinase
MSSPKWQEASQIVQEARLRPAQERTAYINKACAGNEPLLQEVEILLRYYSASEGEQSKPEPSAPITATKPLEHWSQPSRRTQPPTGASTNPPSGSITAKVAEKKTETTAEPAQADWFNSNDQASFDAVREAFRRTTGILPNLGTEPPASEAPTFDTPAFYIVPPASSVASGNATTELINELSKGLEPLYSDAAIHPLPPSNGQPPGQPVRPSVSQTVNLQNTTEEIVQPLASGRETARQADTPSQRVPKETPQSHTETEKVTAFNAPTVRPVFDQPAQRAQLDQETYRPLYPTLPDLSAPPVAEPSVQRPNFDRPSQPDSGKQSAPQSSFNQPLQHPQAQHPQAQHPQTETRPRPSFDQPAQRPNFNPTSVRPERPGFDQASGRTGNLPSPGQSQQLDGRMLAHYQVLTEIGRGGMGRVYLAQDTRLGRRVALKLLSRHSTHDPERVRRFQQEARAASALNHPNILTIHEIGEHKGVQYLATEYVEGRTLRSLVERGRFKLSVATEVAIQVASALEVAHRANIVHRDIKPENLMLRPDGYIKVLDFGVAKLLENTEGDTGPAARRGTSGEVRESAANFETKPGVVVGTASYMSPEQARGLRIDRRTDIFSLGIVLYELVTGQCPFKGPTQSDVLASLLAHDPMPLAQLLPNVQPALLQELQRILDRALEKDRERRYQSAKEFVVDLKAFKQLLVEPWRTGTFAQPLAAPPSGTLPTEAKVDPPAAQTVLQADAVTTLAEHTAADIVVKPDTDQAQTGGVEKASPFWQRQRRILIYSALCLAAAVTLVYLAYLAYGYWQRRTPDISIAVLPFEYTQTMRSDDAEREYLADGLTENLIQRLSQVTNLKVIARNSVFRYKGKMPDARTVGQALNVATVLNGRLTPRGGSLTVTVELVDTRTSAIIWGQQYESEARDVHLLQSNLANRIAEQLRLRLSGAEQQRLASRDTENVEAYKLYLKGRHLWNQRTGDAIKRSIENFQRAVLLDPNYARAYAALADSYALAPIYSETAPEEALAAGKDAAARALELDPQLAEPHAALGFIRHQYEWNWEGAEQAYQRALSLNENYATAHQWYSSYLSSLGKAAEAISQAERARELDPVSTPISTNLGATLYYARKFSQAVAQFQKALELNPNAAGVHAHLGMAFEQQQQYELSLAAFQRALALAGNNTQMKLRLARTWALMSRTDEARKLLDEVQQNAAPGTVPLYLVASIYTALGEKEQALATLTQAVALREEGIIWLKVDPQLDPLRNDARFTALLKSVGFAK